MTRQCYCDQKRTSKGRMALAYALSACHHIGIPKREAEDIAQELLLYYLINKKTCHNQQLYRQARVIATSYAREIQCLDKIDFKNIPASEDVEGKLIEDEIFV